MISFRTALKEIGIGMMSMLLAISVAGSVYAPVFVQNQQKAEAIVVEDLIAWVQRGVALVYQAYQYVAANWGRWKEQYLDPAVWNIINLVLQNMMRDTTAWINNGFQGRPAFIQNPDGFLTGIADKVVGNYLNSTELGNFLCSPWRVDVRAVLKLSYKKTRDTAPVCTVTGMIDGIQYNMQKFQQFVNGNFLQGGWTAWFQFTQNPQYNQYGAILMAEEQMSVKIKGAKGQEYGLVQSASGFLSSKKCTEKVDGNTGKVTEKCDIVTPGQTIEKSLNNQLDGGRQRIQVADEFNELVAAFFSQMVQKALAGGVADTLGSGPSNYYNGGNSPNIAQPGSPITEAIASETAYRAAAQELFNRILAAATYKENTYPPIPIYETDAEGNSTGVITGYRPNNCHTGALTPELISRRDALRRSVEASNDNIVLLNDIKARYDAAVAATPPRTEEQAQIMQEFVTLQGSNTLRSQPDVEALTQIEGMEINDLINGNPISGIVGLIPEIDLACKVDTRDQSTGA